MVPSVDGELLISAGDPKTPKKKLDELSKCGNRQVKVEVALNPSTSSETLDFLSRDKISDVRRAVAENPNTKAKTLAKLSEDSFSYVRVAVTRNPSTALETLLNSASAEVRCAALLSSKCTRELKRKFESKQTFSTKEIIAIANAMIDSENQKALREWSAEPTRRYEKYKQVIDKNIKNEFTDSEYEQIALLSDLYIVYSQDEFEEGIVKLIEPEGLLEGLIYSGYFLELEEWTFSGTLLSEGYSAEMFRWNDAYFQSLEHVGAIKWKDDWFK